MSHACRGIRHPANIPLATQRHPAPLTWRRHNAPHGSGRCLAPHSTGHSTGSPLQRPWSSLAASTLTAARAHRARGRAAACGSISGGRGGRWFDPAVLGSSIRPLAFWSLVATCSATHCVPTRLPWGSFRASSRAIPGAGAVPSIRGSDPCAWPLVTLPRRRLPMATGALPSPWLLTLLALGGGGQGARGAPAPKPPDAHGKRDRGRGTFRKNSNYKRKPHYVLTPGTRPKGLV